mgnify:CR=1 FL=1
MTSSNFSAIRNAEPLVSDVLAVREFIYADGELAGLTYKQPLLPGINEAQCPSGRHSAPEPGHSCGFYAFDDPSKRFGSFSELYGDDEIAAVVRLSGRVIVCESGVRAERMELVAFSTASMDMRNELEDKFSVPGFATREKMLDVFQVEKLERQEPKPKRLDAIADKVSASVKRLNPVASKLKRLKKFLDRTGVTNIFWRSVVYTMLAFFGAAFIFMELTLYGREGVNVFGPFVATMLVLIMASTRSVMAHVLILASLIISMSQVTSTTFEGVPEDVLHFASVTAFNIVIISFSVLMMRFFGWFSTTTPSALVTPGGGSSSGSGSMHGAASSNLNLALNSRRTLPPRAYVPKGGDNDGESREDSEGS